MDTHIVGFFFLKAVTRQQHLFAHNVLKAVKAYIYKYEVVQESDRLTFLILTVKQQLDRLNQSC